MPRVKADDQGKLILPNAFLDRRYNSSETESWTGGREGDLTIQPYLSDVRMLKIERCP
jgi:hypothetical protein